MVALIKMPLVVTKTALSRAKIYSLIKEGCFPKPVKLSKQSVAWVESEVEEWLQARIEQRDAGEQK